ncbi:nucleoid occlusion protein [Sporolactobacillus shoreicorticis]|uniref:Nucleoid occlusion protein n=1 Tax=Sporolactobacillus shoreicorticis TaxID=1923877 RepID=A0ABW5SA13_9BACL|nr:nucleoid occlusion protein [Sporolactobacillus shoreicorticis]MCO7126094.1 nucleoid occlusion protein [Sporolactobacillus shoreicorticis]
MKNHFSKIFNHNAQEETAAALDAEQELEQARVQEIKVSLIIPNQYQPRSVFDEEKIHELATTIEEHGVIQPIVLRPTGDKYEIIAGERRWRAVSSLGWETIPAIIKSLNDDQSASIALIENLQREELTAIEEAMAYARLIDIHGLTQESLAAKLGRGQSTIANKLRLLKLPSSVQSAILKKKISERHARALIILRDPFIQEKMLEEILAKQLNVKQTEAKVKHYLEKADNKVDDNKKNRRFSMSRDSRIAVNTIRQSVHMVTDSGLDIDTQEQDMGDYYQFTIRIPKKK